MATRIILNETSYHGAGAVKSITAELAARGLKKPIVFSDPDLIKFGVTKKVTDLLDGAKVAYAVYSEIKPNPTIENVKNGVKAFKWELMMPRVSPSGPIKRTSFAVIASLSRVSLSRTFFFSFRSIFVTRLLSNVPVSTSPMRLILLE